MIGPSFHDRLANYISQLQSFILYEHIRLLFCEGLFRAARRPRWLSAIGGAGMAPRRQKTHTGPQWAGERLFLSGEQIGFLTELVCQKTHLGNGPAVQFASLLVAENLLYIGIDFIDAGVQSVV